MAQFSLVDLFASRGFSVSFNETNLLQFGYPDCTPLAAVVQINSRDKLTREEIDTILQRTRKNCPKLSFLVILNFGGFNCNHGKYSNSAFLLDPVLIKQMILGEDIFRSYLLSIIQEKGKPQKDSSLEMWANQQAQLFQKGQLPESETIILRNAGIISIKATYLDEWSNNLFKYKNIIDTPRSNAKISEELRAWVKLQYDDWENQVLSIRKQKQMCAYNLLWPEEHSLNQRYNDLIGFIDKYKRLPFDYEAKLYRFMMKIVSGTHKIPNELRDRFARFDPSVECEEKLWLSSLEAIVNEFIAAKRRIWKLSPETISWINSQMQSNADDRISKLKRRELARQLKCTGEQIDYEWLVTLNTYSQMTAPPNLESKMWVWAVQQRRPDIEIYKRKALRKIKFDFTAINYQWYDCYQRIGHIRPELRKNASSIGKDGIYWAYANRQSNAAGNLSAEKRSLLMKIEFDFKEDEFQWLRMYEKAKEFYDIKNIGFNIQVPDDLKEWCADQREQLASLNLTSFQVEKLLSIGFVVMEPNFEDFLAKLNRLVYQNKGKLPQNFEHNAWISSNPLRLSYAREVYHLQNPALSEIFLPIMVHFPTLLEFWRYEGIRRQLYTEKMQSCANYIRDIYKKGTLEPDIAEQLNQVGFCWEEASTEKWLYMLAKVKHFFILFQRPPAHTDKDCCTWRFQQLRLYKNNNLSEFKQNALKPFIIKTLKRANVPKG